MGFLGEEFSDHEYFQSQFHKKAFRWAGGGGRGQSTRMMGFLNPVFNEGQPITTQDRHLYNNCPNYNFAALLNIASIEILMPTLMATGIGWCQAGNWHAGALILSSLIKVSCCPRLEMMRKMTIATSGRYVVRIVNPFWPELVRPRGGDRPPNFFLFSWTPGRSDLLKNRLTIIRFSQKSLIWEPLYVSLSLSFRDRAVGIYSLHFGAQRQVWHHS